MSNMEEPKNSTVKHDKKNKTPINKGKAAPPCGGGGGGGGGLGVGIIFLGGAVATAAFLLIRRQLKSSNRKKSNQDQSTASTEIPYKLIEDKYMNEDKGLFSVAPNSPHMRMDQHSRYGTSSTGVREIDSRVVSDETTFLQDKNDNLEANGKDEIPVADGEDVTHSISPEVLDRQDSSTRFDASALKEKEFPLPIVIEDKTLLQPTIVEDRLATQEFEKVKVDNADGPVPVDQGIEEDADRWEQENMGEPHSKEAAETTKTDQSMLAIMQSSEEQERPIYGCEESKRIGNSLPKTSEFVVERSFQQLSGSSSLSDDENIDNHPEETAPAITIAVVEKDEELEAANEENDKVDGALFPEHFGTDETNEKLDACCEDEGAEITTNLMFAEVEEKCNPHNCSLLIRTKEDEALEATDEFQDEGNTVILRENLKKCQVGLPISEAMEVAEEVHEEADGKEETKLLLVGEEKRAQNYAKMTGEQSKETRETAQLPDDNASGSNHQLLQIDIAETSPNSYQEDTSASDEPTCVCNQWENISANVPNVSLTSFNTPAKLKPEIRIDSGFQDAQQSVEASEVKKENVASEPGSDDRYVENLPMQLAEKQEKQKYLNDECGTLEESEDAVQLSDESNVIPEEHKLMRSEEDPNDHADETNLASEVEECSERTGDSSADSNADPLWPAESIQDQATEPDKMDEDNPQQPKEEQSVEKQADAYLNKVDNHGIVENRLQKADDNKGSLKLTLFERYMLRLGELTHQTTNSRKRILTLTVMVLSGSSCIWYFALPFLKICLIIILVVVLYKMHGF